MARQSRHLRLSLICSFTLCVASVVFAQIPASLQVPVLGYVYDATARGIRPIVGIPGSSSLDELLPLGMSVEKVAFLPDQWHAIVGSADALDAAVVDLRSLKSVPIPGASSSITEIRISARGAVAALYYAPVGRIVLVDGLPEAPVIRTTIDLSMVRGALRRFAVSDGESSLLSFYSDEKESLYAWNASSGLRYVANATRVSDIAFSGNDAIYLDSGSDQAFRIRNIPENAAPEILADSETGLLQPAAVFVSGQGEIFIGDSDGGILILDSIGLPLRKSRCQCTITAMEPLAKSTLRLTERIDQPIYVLDGSDADRIIFIPALPADAEHGATP
jgi:hypothetical protein